MSQPALRFRAFEPFDTALVDHIRVLVAIVALNIISFGQASGTTIGTNPGQLTATPLPQKPGSTAGPGVSSSFKHGAYNGATPMYPANPQAAMAGRLLSTKDVLARTHLDDSNIAAQGLKLQVITLRRWSDVQRQPQMNGFSLAAISPGRLIYEVTTIFSSPYSYHGNTWSSGKHIFVVDAESGAPLYGRVEGRLTHSNHLDDLRQQHH